MSTFSRVFFITIAFLAIFALAQSLAIRSVKDAGLWVRLLFKKSNSKPEFQREECKTICLDWYYCMANFPDASWCTDRLQGCDCPL
ncbi:hypothetical protein L596_022148 [Steinernema carpocapsae]|uniref:Uncharacterized protein n=1 Tax=Steinernema carpocapsae TaxID=34508 RepID=A0A4U5MKW8_STECR|nr:hypothetical protein L596_022148 [Steinernema carpocapsae]